MATTILLPVKPLPAFTETDQAAPPPSYKRSLGGRALVMSWAVMALALVGFNLFAYQTLLVPQMRDEAPAWHGAAWIAAPQTQSPVVYARKTFLLQTIPNNAFVTVQGWQSFTLYVNGHLLDATQNDVTSGKVNQAYSYDLTPFLQVGQNSIALRVDNNDQGAAAVRVVAGVDFGNHLQTYPSGASWLTTADPTLVHPLHSTGSQDWRTANYAASGWRNAVAFAGATPRDGVLHTPPTIYETAMPTVWVTAGAADAFFYRQFDLSGTREVWLRVASNGQAQIFINGQEVVNQPLHLDQDAFNNTTPSQPLLTMGLYDLTSYLHDGANSIAMHVATAVSADSLGTPKPAAMMLDIIALRTDGSTQHVVADQAWQATDTSSNADWANGAGTAHWPNALTEAGTAFTAMAPDKVFAINQQLVNPWSALGTLAVTTLLFLLLCGIGILVLLFFGDSRLSPSGAIRAVALALAPSVALMGLLLVMNLEPLMPRPFPFTSLWLALLIGLSVACFILLLLAPRWSFAMLRQRLAGIRQATQANLQHTYAQLPPRVGSALTLARLREWWPVSVLALIGLVLTTYQLGYEAYWQDEATSIYAAMGILHNGIPHMLSGFIYPKAELYSYMLAALIALFGSAPEVTRLLSVVEFVASLVLTYAIARAFFARQRVALLAMALLLFSPMALLWAREARMYQQAELMVLIVVYLFYRALQTGARPRMIYFSMLSVVVMYLSHEETFIVLPVLLVYFFATQRLRWVRNPHWWIAGLSAISVIFLQLFIAQATHPALLGTDHTQQPNIALNGANIDYFLRLLFDAQSLPHGNEPLLTVITVLAMVACVRALFAPDRVLRYLSLWFVLPMLSLMTIFTLAADRYVLPLLPIMAMLAASTVFWLLDDIVQMARGQVPSLATRLMPSIVGVLLLATVLLSQTVGIANFSLATSRALGLPYQHRYPDYQAAGAYIRAHWQPGDILITIAPAIDGAYYAELPSYLIYADKALYFSAQNDQIGELATGAVALLSDQDVATVLASHHRIWLLAANGYTCCGGTNTATVLQNFALMFEGQSTYVYLRSS